MNPIPCRRKKEGRKKRKGQMKAFHQIWKGGNERAKDELTYSITGSFFWGQRNMGRGKKDSQKQLGTIKDSMKIKAEETEQRNTGAGDNENETKTNFLPLQKDGGFHDYRKTP